jgi:hypothetical protein
MKITSPLAWTILAVACFLAAGCDTPPAAPKANTPDHVNALTVRPNDDEEVRGAMALETARVAYQNRLEVLRSYYERVGDADKYQAAGRELKTLRQAQVFRYQDLPEILPP